jgi:hypothetical protein
MTGNETVPAPSEVAPAMKAPKAMVKDMYQLGIPSPATALKSPQLSLRATSTSQPIQTKMVGMATASSWERFVFGV